MIIITDYVKASGQGVHMFSERGASTIQNYNCFSRNQKSARPPWKRPKRTTNLNPERMSKGITREDFRDMEVAAATAGLDSDGEVEMIKADTVQTEQDAGTPEEGGAPVRKTVKVNNFLKGANPA